MKNFIVSLFTSEPFLFVKGALIFLLGPLNLQLAYLLLAVGIDLIFGIEVARKEQAFRWNILFKKVRKKIFVYALWISMFHAFDMIMGLPDSARWAVVLMLAGMEIISAAKNTAKLGHTKLADALEGVYFALTKSQTGVNVSENAQETGTEALIVPVSTEEGSGTNEQDTTRN